MQAQITISAWLLVGIIALAFVVGTLVAHPRRDDQLAGAFTRGLLT
jgi:uncharacterized membrane protein